MPLFASQVWRSLFEIPATIDRAVRSALYARGSSRRGGPWVASGRVMGTYYVITLVSRPRPAQATVAQEAARERLVRVEALMSTYLTQSDLGRFNAAGADEWIGVSRETVQCLDVACEIGAASGGLFEVTAGPLVRLWGFGPGEGFGGVPDEALVSEARRYVGLDKVDMRSDPPALRKRSAGVQIDLASIAKGCAVDLACEALDELGARDYCVEVGGEVRTRGRNARRQPWRIAIESPQGDQHQFQRMVCLSGQAMATSGDYRIYGEHDGQRYPHVIDPRTGRPVQHELTSVTVIDASCARADAWATALMVAGPEAGYELALRERLAVLFVVRSEQKLNELQTPRFPS